MSDTSGLPNTDGEGVPAEDDPTRFEAQPQGEGESEGEGAVDAGVDGGAERDAQATEPAETDDPDGAEPPPAELDPAQNPSNPDLVDTTEAPD